MSNRLCRKTQLLFRIIIFPHCVSHSCKNQDHSWFVFDSLCQYQERTWIDDQIWREFLDDFCSIFAIILFCFSGIFSVLKISKRYECVVSGTIYTSFMDSSFSQLIIKILSQLREENCNGSQLQYFNFSWNFFVRLSHTNFILAWELSLLLAEC